ncbi:entericidin [Pseudotabrizicola sp. 4114]|nr:putative small secreted protein [Pseudorhodobacter sp. 4114]
MRKLSLMAAAAALIALTGCATVDGIGRDISGGANRVAGWVG